MDQRPPSFLPNDIRAADIPKTSITRTARTTESSRVRISRLSTVNVPVDSDCYRMMIISDPSRLWKNYWSNNNGYCIGLVRHASNLFIDPFVRCSSSEDSLGFQVIFHIPL
jgi:hypothetical protein